MAVVLTDKIRENKKTTALLAGIALSAVIIFASDVYINVSPNILPQVRIAYLDVGKATREQAKTSLQAFLLEAKPWQIALTDQRDVWLINQKDISLDVDVEASVAAAYALGRESSFSQRWIARWTAWRVGTSVPLVVRFNRDQLIKSVEALGPSLNRQPRDASIAPQGKDVALIPSVEGRRVNSKLTADEAWKAPQKHLSFVVDLLFDKEAPKVPDTAFKGITKVLSSYTTNFNPWDSERNANIRLAAGRIHGTVLKPGETFSYNTTVGHRTQQEGFRMAPVILDGKLVPDWGGGVCQVSSTLYNAVLMADMEIVERVNHGRAIGYVPLGFDATVVDNQIDFKFRNKAANPIILYANITSNEMQFLFLGHEADLPPPIDLEYVVLRVYEPVEVKQMDPTIDAGKEVVEEPPQRGFRVSTWRIRKVGNNEERQHLFTDDYDPVNRIVKIGTKGTSPQPPAKKDTPSATTTVPPTSTSSNTSRITLTR